MRERFATFYAAKWTRHGSPISVWVIYTLNDNVALGLYTPPQGCLESILRGHHAAATRLRTEFAFDRRAELLPRAVDEGEAAPSGASITHLSGQSHQFGAHTLPGGSPAQQWQ